MVVLSENVLCTCFPKRAPVDDINLHQQGPIGTPGIRGDPGKPVSIGTVCFGSFTACLVLYPV